LKLNEETDKIQLYKECNNVITIIDANTTESIWHFLSFDNTEITSEVYTPNNIYKLAPNSYCKLFVPNLQNNNELFTFNFINYIPHTFELASPATLDRLDILFTDINNDPVYMFNQGHIIEIILFV